MLKLTSPRARTCEVKHPQQVGQRVPRQQGQRSLVDGPATLLACAGRPGTVSTLPGWTQPATHGSGMQRLQRAAHLLQQLHVLGLLIRAALLEGAHKRVEARLHAAHCRQRGGRGSGRSPKRHTVSCPAHGKKQACCRAHSLVCMQSVRQPCHVPAHHGASFVCQAPCRTRQVGAPDVGLVCIGVHIVGGQRHRLLQLQWAVAATNSTASEGQSTVGGSVRDRSCEQPCS